LIHLGNLLPGRENSQTVVKHETWLEALVFENEGRHSLPGMVRSGIKEACVEIWASGRKLGKFGA
jgi:hypothetical protein